MGVPAVGVDAGVAVAEVELADVVDPAGVVVPTDVVDPAGVVVPTDVVDPAGVAAPVPSVPTDPLLLAAATAVPAPAPARAQRPGHAPAPDPRPALGSRPNWDALHSGAQRRRAPAHCRQAPGSWRCPFWRASVPSVSFLDLQLAAGAQV